MKYKVAELSGELLDAAVAKADPDTYKRWFGAGPLDDRSFEPSADWSIAGPIIERERRFCLQAPDALEEQLGRGSWGAIVLGSGIGWCHGPTALIAAMRAYVASKLGEEVDL